MKARREIGDYIKNKRIERARIRVCFLFTATWSCDPLTHDFTSNISSS